MSPIEKERKLICKGCGGFGRISFFNGVSRFLISNEECTTCSGLGYIFVDDDVADRKGGINDHSNGSKDT